MRIHPHLTSPIHLTSQLEAEDLSRTKLGGVDLFIVLQFSMRSAAKKCAHFCESQLGFAEAEISTRSTALLLNTEGAALRRRFTRFVRRVVVYPTPELQSKMPPTRPESLRLQCNLGQLS